MSEDVQEYVGRGRHRAGTIDTVAVPEHRFFEPLGKLISSLQHLAQYSVGVGCIEMDHHVVSMGSLL